MEQGLPGFVQALFEDGSLAKQQTPEELVDLLVKHEKWDNDWYAFFVSCEDALNEMSPAEVLAGKFFQAQIDNPTRTVWDGATNRAVAEPLTEGYIKVKQRFLDKPLEERVAHVIHVSRDTNTIA